MKTFASFVLLLALAAADIAAVRAGTLPLWCLVFAAACVITATVIVTLAIAAETSVCQLCSRPLIDRQAAGDYAVKYGIRACGDCGPRLDHRFGGEDAAPGPPYPPNFP